MTSRPATRRREFAVFFGALTFLAAVALLGGCGGSGSNDARFGDHGTRAGQRERWEIIVKKSVPGSAQLIVWRETRGWASAVSTDGSRTAFDLHRELARELADLGRPILGTIATDNWVEVVHIAERTEAKASRGLTAVRR